MAYILGLLFADGNVVTTNRGTRYFALYSADKQLLDVVRKTMHAQQKISKRNARSGNIYRLQIGSKIMVSDLFEHGLSEGKSRRMQFPNIPKKHIGHFIRGYFDGDGNVWIGASKSSQKHRSMIAAFTSASKLFLEFLHNELRAHGISGGSLFLIKGKDCYRLSFSVTDALKIGELMYNSGAFGRLYLKRKKAIFDAFIKMRT